MQALKYDVRLDPINIPKIQINRDVAIRNIKKMVTSTKATFGVSLNTSNTLFRIVNMKAILRINKDFSIKDGRLKVKDDIRFSGKLAGFMTGLIKFIEGFAILANVNQGYLNVLRRFILEYNLSAKINNWNKYKMFSNAIIWGKKRLDVNKHLTNNDIRDYLEENSKQTTRGIRQVDLEQGNRRDITLINSSVLFLEIENIRVDYLRNRQIDKAFNKARINILIGTPFFISLEAGIKLKVKYMLDMLNIGQNV